MNYNMITRMVVLCLLIGGASAVIGDTITLTAIADSNAWSQNPDTNYGSSSMIYIGKYIDGTSLETYLKFNLGSLPANIDSAVLQFYRANSAGSYTGIVGKVASSWSESTITWVNRPGSTGGVYSFLPNSGGTTVSIGVTSFVQGWIDSPSTNYGFRVGYTGTPGSSNYTGFVARETVFASERPKLVVTYTPPDSENPSVTITGPTSNTTYVTANNSVTVSGNASDDIGVTSVTWSSNRGGSGSCSGTTTWSKSGIALYGGSNMITIRAYDAVGKSGSDTINVIYDIESPFVQITSPTAGSNWSTSSNSLNIAGTTSDDYLLDRVTWSNNRGGSGTCSGTTSWSKNGITLYSGTNLITVTAYDLAGRTDTDTLNVIYSPPDITDPSISITSPTSNSTWSTSSSSLNIAGTASDNVAVTSVTWSNNRGGSGTCSGTTSWSKNSITLYSGSNILTVTAWDAANNTKTDTLSVTYTPADTTNPSISITSPTSSSTYSTSSSSINIGGSASDNIGVTSVTWSNDRGGSGTCSGTTSWSKSSITLYSGSNILTVTAWDAANNTNTDTLAVTFNAPGLATVTTTSVSSITETTASSGGNVIDVGGSSVTTRGVCWSTSPSPTTSDNKTTDGSGTGSFTSSLTGLTADTTYYVRAYATNSTDTAYGSQVSFATGGLPTVLINEIDPGNTTEDWVEIYNYGGSAIDFTGWTLQNYNSTTYNFPGGFTIPADSYVVIHEYSGTDTATDLYTGSDIGFTASNGYCSLLDDSSSGVDFVRWGSSSETPPSGTSWIGTISGTPAAGASIARDALSVDFDDATDWDVTCGLDAFMPTPGAINDYVIADSDSDGLDDNWEITNFGNLFHDGTADSDFDGLTDLIEFQISTDPNDPDSDGDGYEDGYEYDNGYNPNDPSSKPSSGDKSKSFWSRGCSNSGTTDSFMIIVLAVTMMTLLARRRWKYKVVE